MRSTNHPAQRDERHPPDGGPGDIRASTLAALYRKLEEPGRRADGPTAHNGEPLSLNTVLKVHVLIGAILQSAVDDQLIALNPARHPRANPPTAREVRAAKPEICWSKS